MPNLSSAKKALRQSERDAAKNRRYKNRVKTLGKEIVALVKEGKMQEAAAQLSLFYKAVDKAAKHNILHKNTASRRKAVMAKRVRLQEATAEASNSQAK